MKRLLSILILALLTCVLLAVEEDKSIQKFDKAQVVKAKQVEVVRFEPLKPDIERYQKKTSTDLTKGFYQLYKNNIRTTNRVLLNKWLKEFK